MAHCRRYKKQIASAHLPAKSGSSLRDFSPQLVLQLFRLHNRYQCNALFVIAAILLLLAGLILLALFK